MSKISKEVLRDPLALFRQFEIIEDPRIDRHKRYPLINILVFAFVAILSAKLVSDFCFLQIQFGLVRTIHRCFFRSSKP